MVSQLFDCRIHKGRFGEARLYKMYYQDSSYSYYHNYYLLGYFCSACENWYHNFSNILPFQKTTLS